MQACPHCFSSASYDNVAVGICKGSTHLRPIRVHVAPASCPACSSPPPPKLSSVEGAHSYCRNLPVMHGYFYCFEAAHRRTLATRHIWVPGVREKITTRSSRNMEIMYVNIMRARFDVSNSLHTHRSVECIIILVRAHTYSTGGTLGTMPVDDHVPTVRRVLSSVSAPAASSSVTISLSPSFAAQCSAVSAPSVLLAPSSLWLQHAAASAEAYRTSPSDAHQYT